MSMRNWTKACAFSAAGWLLLCAASVHAAPIVNSFGLAAPSSTITFDELVLPDSTLITNQYSGLGVTFSPGLRYNSQGPSVLSGITGNYAGNNGAAGPILNPFSIIFGTPQTAAAFGFATNPANTLVEALLGASVVESFTQATTFDNNATAFLGFSGIAFDQIRITVGGDQQGLVDNIQVGVAAAVPEPATLTFFGTALLALGALRRRRKAEV